MQWLRLSNLATYSQTQQSGEIFNGFDLFHRGLRAEWNSGPKIGDTDASCSCSRQGILTERQAYNRAISCVVVTAL